MAEPYIELSIYGSALWSSIAPSSGGGGGETGVCPRRLIGGHIAFPVWKWYARSERVRLVYSECTVYMSFLPFTITFIVKEELASVYALGRRRCLVHLICLAKINTMHRASAAERKKDPHDMMMIYSTVPN